jgi:acetaldehyde dehydrogenase (acetylating)
LNRTEKHGRALYDALRDRRTVAPPVEQDASLTIDDAYAISLDFLEVEGAGDYLPSYSGNLDIMTAAAKATGELLAKRVLDGRKVAA